jgi:hypothetical protein
MNRMRIWTLGRQRFILSVLFILSEENPDAEKVPGNLFCRAGMVPIPPRFQLAGL